LRRSKFAASWSRTSSSSRAAPTVPESSSAWKNPSRPSVLAGGKQAVADFLALAREVAELGNHVALEDAAASLVGIGHLHRLEEDVDEVPLLARSLEHDRVGVDIIDLDEARALADVLEISYNVILVAEAERRDAEGDYEYEAYRHVDYLHKLLLVCFLLEHDVERYERSRDKKRRRQRTEDETPDNVGIRALDRREQMIDDLIEGDVPPDVHRPQHRKDQKSKHQCQNSYADYP